MAVSSAHDSTAAVPVAAWVRLGLVALAVPQAFTGLWAIVDPSGWFNDYPGFDPRLVAAIPPYNAHLAADAGAGFLATAVALVLAAWWGDRRVVLLALATYLSFAVPHLVYHVVNPSPGLTDAEDLRNVATLVIAVAFPMALGWGAYTKHPGEVHEGPPEARARGDRAVDASPPT